LNKLFALVTIVATLSTATACDYIKLFRPSVLKQLNLDVVRLLNEFPNVDQPNEDIVGRLFAHGVLSEAKEKSDGSMRDQISH
jgi:hypothetical protein